MRDVSAQLLRNTEDAPVSPGTQRHVLDALAAAAAAAANPPVNTFVIGVGDQIGELNSVAAAGGTGRDSDPFQTIAEFNAIGYYGTNASGGVYVIESVFRNNRLGMTPNSQRMELLAPQVETVIAGNLVVDNDEPRAPAIGAGFFGGGIAIGGGTRNTVLRNRVEGHDGFGIGLIDLNDFDPAENRVTPGLSETTTFTISVDDGIAAVDGEDPSRLEEAEEALLRLLRAQRNDIELERRLSGHILKIELNQSLFWAALAEVRRESTAAQTRIELIRRDAPAEMLRALYGMGDKEYTRLRRHHGVPSGVGRPLELDPDAAWALSEVLHRYPPVPAPKDWLAIADESGVALRTIWREHRRWQTATSGTAAGAADQRRGA